MGKVDTTLFTKKIGKDLFVLQIHVDDIIFGSTNQDYCEEFGKMMANKFEMSMIRDLSYFLGLQIKQFKNGTFVSQSKYIKDMLKKFGMKDAKAISTPMGTNGNLDSDASGNMVI
jgi:spore maturation protein CgeB